MKLDKDFFLENIKTLFYALVIAIIINDKENKFPILKKKWKITVNIPTKT